MPQSTRGWRWHSGSGRSVSSGDGSAGATNSRPGVEALELEVNSLRQELSDAQERIDFAERLLAQNKDRHQ